jgi:hypothetical protein
MIHPNGGTVFFPNRFCPSLDKRANLRFIVNVL